MEPKPATPEVISTPVNAWLFDVDGVLTNLTEKRGVDPEHFTAFSDSVSDFEMYDELLVSNKKVKFVFVGKNAEREDIEITTENYDSGTLEYLQNN